MLTEPSTLPGGSVRELADLSVKMCPGCARPNLPERARCWRCDADLVAVSPGSPVRGTVLRPAAGAAPRATSRRSRALAYWAAGVLAAAVAGTVLVLSGGVPAAR